MKQKQLCTCDKCDKEFQIKVKERRSDDIEAMFFLCPRCGTAYMISMTNSALRFTMRYKKVGKDELLRREKELFEYYRQQIESGQFGRVLV